MKILWKALLRAKIWQDTHGQDMIEYALLAGFITVTVGATFPPAATPISVIFSKIESLAANAATR